MSYQPINLTDLDVSKLTFRKPQTQKYNGIQIYYKRPFDKEDIRKFLLFMCLAKRKEIYLPKELWIMIFKIYKEQFPIAMPLHIKTPYIQCPFGS